MLVLDVVADDFENFEKMLEEMAVLSAAVLMNISPADVTEAIAFLITRGWIKAYDLRTQRAPIELPGVPPPEQIEECYYYQTLLGKKINGIDDYCPLDDEFKLKSSWSFPF